MEAKEKTKKKVKRPTADKRLIQDEKKRLVNKAFKSQVRTAIRNFETAIAAKEEEKISSTLSEIYSFVDKCVKRRIYKQGKADRTKSRFTAKAASAK